MIRVKVYKEGEAVLKVDLRKEDLIVGRDSHADVQLASGAVSRRHARLQKTDEGWQVADMGAANGVYVARGGGEPTRIVIQKVEPGDVIIIETFQIKFEELEDTAPAEFDTKDGGEFQESSLETKRTQFISMVDVLEDKSQAVPTSDEGAPVGDEGAVKQVRPGTWWARMQSDAGHDRVFTVDKPSATVGTDGSCDVKLPTGPARIVDLDRSGPSVALRRVARWPFPRVLVDGVSVKESVLGDGDSFSIGGVVVSVHLEDEPAKR